MVCPCKDCNKREIGCHSKCEGYLEFVKWNDERKKAERETQKYYNMFRSRKSKRTYFPDRTRNDFY